MKLFDAFGLFLNHLPLFAALVLTVWVPANLAVEYITYHVMDAEDVFGAMRLNMFMAGVFGPISAGAVVYAAAAIQRGRPVSYGEAMGVGLQNWGRLFGARLIAGILIWVGFILLILPGVYLAIRWALLDPAVVLDNAGVYEARKRSSDLVRGRELRIFGTAVLFFAGFIFLSFVVAVPMVVLAELDNFVVSAAGSCVLDLGLAVLGIAMFLYYWEARQEELGGAIEAEPVPARDEPGNLPPPGQDIPDDGNPYRTPLA